jgi:N-acetylneuraminic acid mutarotase
MQILILFVAVLSGGNVEQNSSQETSSVNYPPIPEKVTSFGAAVLDGQLYIYGGHTGGAHAYDKNSQANTLRRLDLGKPKAWQALAQGPGLQGLALVACNGKLYRVGGFTAKNEKGDDHDLWSQAGVACYDPATNQWTDLSPLPEPRSSFDSAVLDKKIYVIGGWKLAGDEEEHWHKSACVLDLSAATPQWQKIPEPPFQRRALAVAAFDGKIYVIGGMQQEGGPTKQVDIFDPQTGKWSQGPSLHGERMDGFGPSAFATGGRLYVSTYSGSLQQLAKDGQSWEIVRDLERARFFHRMLPLSDSQLISVGGANMESGKYDQVDVIDLSR